uniref:cyclin-A2 n=1 Tax=Ciona intestinalis TaxID=7719 RepID=UPI00005249A5|nr:cyclin-A2 [Ciona intestinalis]|eukprot:XP_002125998.2 cyclin-A2 [Ciona intestinalis]
MSHNVLSTRSTSHVGDNRQKPFNENAGARPKTTQGRAVLGVISQNTASGRVQPFRAAKQNATTEGFFSGQPPVQKLSGQNFKIFDECSSNNDAKVQQKPSVPAIASNQLHPALTALPSTRQPLVNLPVNVSLSSVDSPMVLDTSDEERLNIFDIDSNAGIYGLSEYATEIFQHLREAEQLHRPKPNYMRKQQDITVGMRAILVDWLVEVADEYKLHTETTHLAVNYIDRFLSHMAVLRGKLQLVGAAAMFIAAKFEEIYPPDVGEFVYITDDTYTKKQVLRMEHLILKVLNFDVAVPTSNQFLKRYLKSAGADKKTEFLAQFLCELALVEFDCTQYLPSMIAASSVCLASYTVSGKIWDETMEHYMQYQLQDLAPCIKRLHEILAGASKNSLQALFEKYKDAKYDCVSNITATPTLPFDEMEAEEC